MNTPSAQRLRPALRAIALALPGLAALPAHALVESGHWFVGKAPADAEPPFGPQTIFIAVDQTQGGDNTGAIFDHDPATNTLTYLTQHTDEGLQLFLVQAGDALTHAGIATLPASAALTGSITLGNDFYLGVRTGNDADPGFVWNSPEHYTSFGWAHFRQGEDGQLFIVDSAMAFRESGIFVGTAQAVPEPTTWAALIAGLATLGGWARRRVQQAQA